ncbi:selenoprotein K-like [Tubulanus polymorphus]|uniref:selenoprotein K-like n=1 Tax=Tubulanus polymorphus TaxID=672921 RepID=UPI003DA6CCBB
MVYVSSGGQVSESRSPWRLSIVTELFWGCINFVLLFFQTMISPSKTRNGDASSTDYRRPGGGGPPGGPRRRFGGVRHFDDGPSAPPMAGGG